MIAASRSHEQIGTPLGLTLTLLLPLVKKYVRTDNLHVVDREDIERVDRTPALDGDAGGRQNDRT
ncbi:hypothetical protein ACWDA7_33715 [Streptomyces sp. NPDC001156]